jgi:hypothetical protein
MGAICRRAEDAFEMVQTRDALSLRTMTTEENRDENPQPTIFEMIGGATRLRELVDRFYDLMDLEPEFAGIRALHPTAMDGSCPAGPAAPICSLKNLAIRVCARATCRTRSRPANAINGCVAWRWQ